MWRGRFYTSRGSLIYQIFVGFGFLFVLAGTAYNYAATGENQPWALPIVIAGMILFLISKITVLKKGRLFSFGVTAAEMMSGRFKVFYYVGYLLMIIGFLLSFNH